MMRVRFVDDEDVRPACEAARDVVAQGGVILVPTESFYGLAADPKNRIAVDRVHELKRRPRSRALLVLAADWQQVESLVEVPDAVRVRLSRAWPGPLTVVCNSLGPVAASDDGSLAIRIPDHARLRTVLYRVGPLTGTSANAHGLPPATTVEDALDGLGGSPDLILDAGSTAGGAPSTVVDCRCDPVRILRPGRFDWDDFYSGFKMRI